MDPPTKAEVRAVARHLKLPIKMIQTFINRKRASLLLYPFFCGSCDTHQPVCRGCYRPLLGHISGNENVSPYGKSLLWCVGCHGGSSEPGSAIPKYRTWGLRYCSDCQKYANLSKEQVDHCRQNSWSNICESCEVSILSNRFQGLFKSSDRLDFILLPLSKFDTMYGGQCDWCRAIAHAAERVVLEYRKVQSRQEDGEMNLAFAFLRKEDRIHFTFLGPGRRDGDRLIVEPYTEIPLELEDSSIEVFFLTRSHGEYITYLRVMNADSSTDAPEFLKEAIKTTDVNVNVGSPEAFQKARDWLEECWDGPEHEECRTKNERMIPRRIIDVNEAPPKLVDTTEKSDQYAALSYCWGGPQDQKLVDENIQAYSTYGLPLEDLP